MIRLALLYGGKSAEREVSIAGAKEVERALDKNKYQIVTYDAATDLVRLAQDASHIDCVFVLLHGRYGEDGTVQGFLDLLELPYQCSGVLGSAMAMDKHVSKVQYQAAGVPTPRWICLGSPDELDLQVVLDGLGLPLIVKPSSQGSSVGIGIVREEKDLVPVVHEAFSWDEKVILEEFIQGRELTGGVLGLDEPVGLPIVEIIPGEEYPFFDYEAKYQPGATREICPAELTQDLAAKAQELAKQAHRALRLSIYSRTDMILASDGQIYCIETNTIPGMTPTSLFPQAAKAYGLDFSGLLDRLIELALERHKKRAD